MSLQDSIQTVLAASSALSTVFTGGIITYDSLGTLGLNRTGYPAGFDATTGKIKPLIIIRTRQQIPTGALHDEGLQHASAVQAVEIWFYCDRAVGYATLESGQATTYGLLADKVIGAAALRWREHRKNERDTALDMALAVYSVYDANGVLTP